MSKKGLLRGLHKLPPGVSRNTGASKIVKSGFGGELRSSRQAAQRKFISEYSDPYDHWVRLLISPPGFLCIPHTL